MTWTESNGDEWKGDDLDSFEWRQLSEEERVAVMRLRESVRGLAASMDRMASAANAMREAMEKFHAVAWRVELDHHFGPT